MVHGLAGVAGPVLMTQRGSRPSRPSRRRHRAAAAATHVGEQAAVGVGAARRRRGGGPAGRRARGSAPAARCRGRRACGRSRRPASPGRHRRRSGRTGSRTCSSSAGGGSDAATAREPGAAGSAPRCSPPATAAHVHDLPAAHGAGGRTRADDGRGRRPRWRCAGRRPAYGGRPGSGQLRRVGDAALRADDEQRPRRRPAGRPTPAGLDASSCRTSVVAPASAGDERVEADAGRRRRGGGHAATACRPRRAVDRQRPSARSPRSPSHLHDAARGRPRHHLVDADLGHQLDGQLAAVALGDALHHHQPRRRRRLDDPLATTRSSTVSWPRPDDRAAGAGAPAVGEVDGLARPAPAARSPRGALGAGQDDRVRRRGRRTRNSAAVMRAVERLRRPNSPPLPDSRAAPRRAAGRARAAAPPARRRASSASAPRRARAGRRGRCRAGGARPGPQRQDLVRTGCRGGCRRLLAVERLERHLVPSAAAVIGIGDRAVQVVAVARWKTGCGRSWIST